MKSLISTQIPKERALLVGIELPSRNQQVPLAYSLEELERLAETAGATVLGNGLIVTTGSDMHDAVTTAAKAHPDQAFASDDRSITLPNVRHADTSPEVVQLIRDVTNDH